LAPAAGDGAAPAAGANGQSPELSPLTCGCHPLYGVVAGAAAVDVGHTACRKGWKRQVLSAVVAREYNQFFDYVRKIHLLFRLIFQLLSA
jgi:hypothetical protein